MVARTGIRLGANPQYQSVVLFDQYSRTHQSQIFEVRETPIVISAFGLQVGETLQVYASLLSPEGELLEPFLLDGSSVILTSSANSVQLITAGRYRVVFTGTLMLDMVCTYKHQTSGTNKSIRQPSGVQANRPNLFFDGITLSQTSQIIEIQNIPWLFSAYGLLGGESITVYNTYGHGGGYQQEIYLFKGVPQILTPTSNALILNKSGRYRFVLIGDPTHVTLVGNETIEATINADNIVNPGVQSIVAGDNITVDATDPANPIVSASGGNGILPMVTGEIYVDQPRFMYFPDGSLFYVQVE